MKLAVIDRVVSQGLYFNGFAISFKLIRNKSHEKITTFIECLHHFILFHNLFQRGDSTSITERKKSVKLQSIAKEVGVNVEIELFNEHATRPLTNSEINKFKDEFLKIAELNGKKIALTKLSDSRVVESFSYYGGVGLTDTLLT